jgi:CubicO group peptidase (beta-lactamase class C family)
MRRSLPVVLALLAIAAACSSSGGARAAKTTTTTAAALVPGADWVISTPQEHGMDPAKLEKARTYAFAAGRHTQSVVIVRGGEIAAEWYAKGSGPSSWAASWSVAKSFTSAIVGIAIQQGYIHSVDDPIAKYLPDWAGAGHKNVKIRDILHMASGLRWTENYDSPSDVVNMVVYAKDELAYARSRPQAAAPGTVWNYSSGDAMVLSGVIQAATGQPLDEYAAKVLFHPLGFSKVQWWRDAAGHTLSYCCVDTTSRDFARLGLLYLHGGLWGDKRVVPQRWVDDSIQPFGPSHGQYGYMWWLEDFKGVPRDTFLADGHDGQYIFVIPSLDLVVVRNGTYVKDPGPPVATPNLFSKYPSGGIVRGHGTTPPDDWDNGAFLRPIVNAIQR